MPKYKKQFQYFFIISLAILLILSLIPGNGSMFDPLDKVAHFLMYFFVAVPLMGLMSNRSKATVCVFVFILLGIAIEFLQEYIPGRGFEYWDIVANSCGVIFGVYFFNWKKEMIFRKLDRLNAD